MSRAGTGRARARPGDGVRAAPAPLEPGKAPADGAPRPPGRPRAAPRSDPRSNTRDEILQAASVLFSAQGYDATSTRQIAEAVGIRQASLYYHFADKGSILRSILNNTIAPSVAFADRLDDTGAPAAVRLCALAVFDVAGLLRDRWNLQVVYSLTDVGQHERDDARADQAALRAHYRRLTAAVLQTTSVAGSPGEHTSAPGTSAPGTVADADLDLTFGLIEGVITHRHWGTEAERAPYAAAVVRGCLRLVHVPEAEIPAVIDRARTLVEQLAGPEGAGRAVVTDS